MQTLNFGHVPGLTQEEQKQLQDLAAAYNYHQSRNATKDKYYEGHISLRDVNLGIALPQGLRNLEVGCERFFLELVTGVERATGIASLKNGDFHTKICTFSSLFLVSSCTAHTPTKSKVC